VPFQKDLAHLTTLLSYRITASRNWLHCFMTYAYSFTDHFIISFFPFVFPPHSHPMAKTDSKYNGVRIRTYLNMLLLLPIRRLARYTSKYIHFDLIRLSSDCTSIIMNYFHRFTVEFNSNRRCFCYTICLLHAMKYPNAASRI